jgi:LysM repeat protein
VLQIEHTFDEQVFEGGIEMTIHMVNTPATRVRRWVAVLVVAAVALVIAPQAFAQEPGAPAATDTYVVAQGETLWSIAQSITPSDRNVRDTVATLKSMNVMDSSTIHIGDQLIVPLYG